MHVLLMYDARIVTRISFLELEVYFMRLSSELVPTRMRVILLTLCTIVGAVEITSSCLDDISPSFGSLTICKPSLVSNGPRYHQGPAKDFIPNH